MSKASISIDSSSFTRHDIANCYALSNENLDNLHKMVPVRSRYFTNGLARHSNNYSRPSAFSKFAFKHIKRTHKFDVIKHTPPKGLIFVWPQKHNLSFTREYTMVVRIFAQIFYWLNEIGIFPSGSGMPFEQPAWTIKPPVTKPENRDYIIEPDWNSIFY